MSVHTVLMSSGDGTLRWKLSRIYSDREETLRLELATVATGQALTRQPPSRYKSHDFRWRQLR